MHHQITVSLVLVFWSLVIGVITHVLIWRIRALDAYPIWVTVIFVSSFLAVATAAKRAFGYQLLGDDFVGLLGAIFAFVFLTANYISCFAGVVEYSPSDEILLEVQKRMPIGVTRDRLIISSLSTDLLTFKRINHLIRAGMIQTDSAVLSLTSRGRLIVQATIVVRKLLLLPPFGEG